MQIVEPIHDALSLETPIPPDAIKLENGNTIATALVSVALPFGNGNGLLEARLNGYRAHFFNLPPCKHGIDDRARRYIEHFEDAVSAFLSDGTPHLWKLTTPYWLSLDNGDSTVERLLRDLTWLPENPDPFNLGASSTFSQVKFTCSNPSAFWTAAITLEKSALPAADLFVEISVEYSPNSAFGTLGKKAEHLSNLFRSIADRLSLETE